MSPQRQGREKCMELIIQLCTLLHGVIPSTNLILHNAFGLIEINQNN